MYKYIPIISIPLIALNLNAVVISDFQSDTVGTAPSGWHVGNPQWDVALDPLNSSNHVLDTSLRANIVSPGNLPGNQVAGTAAIIDATSTLTLQFDFYMPSTNLIDLGVGMTSVTDLSSISNNDGVSYWGPLLRIDDGVLKLYEGDGSGGGSYLDADQGISTSTWYTVSMTIDNAANTFSASIVGGAFAIDTPLTSGVDDTFGFRNDTTGDLANFILRANTGNTSSTGILIDNIAIIPEPSTYALLLGMISIVIRWRSRRA